MVQHKLQQFALPVALGCVDFAHRDATNPHEKGHGPQCAQGSEVAAAQANKHTTAAAAAAHQA